MKVFRDDYLILHSRKTLLKIKNNNIDEQDLQEVYSNFLDYYIQRFQKKFNTDIIILNNCLVCVENTQENVSRFKELQKTAIDYEKQLVERINKLVFY